jgi:DNA polymerase
MLHPKVIVTLGRYSMARFFPGETISKIHGRARKDGGLIYFAMYHPAAALHQQKLRETIQADMLKIPALLAEAQDAPVTKAADKPQQLSLL